MNKMENLTKQQKELLRQIVNDKFSIGAFSGMIYNSSLEVAKTGVAPNIELLTVKALDVRLKLMEMAE